MKYSDEQRVEKILNYAVKLQDYIAENNVTADKLLNEEKVQWLVTTPLYNIGEHAYNLSKEFKENYAKIEWNMIASLRHRLVHDYEGINWKMISEVVFEDLPIFTEQLKAICEEKGWDISLGDKAEGSTEFTNMKSKLEAAELENQRKDKEIAAWKRRYAELERQVKKSRGGR